MKTALGHLTYCSNIHPGESWPDHFAQLQQHVPLIKKELAPDQPFGIGLRLSHTASLELAEEGTLRSFQQWLQQQNCYVFTMNGFPYGGFHRTVVKDKVHAPDWTTDDRVAYTIRLAQILAALLPDDLDGGISTSPLSYRLWHADDAVSSVFEKATQNLLLVVAALIRVKAATGKLIHIDIEPEPDGLLGEGADFFHWYTHFLLPMGVTYLQKAFGYTKEKATEDIREHVQLCYDVCHFAVGYEDHAATVKNLQSHGIKTGKIQLSAALKATLPATKEEKTKVVEAFRHFNEPVYLHQVVARQQNGTVKRYADMPDAIADAANDATTEWRAHYHVPLFIKSYGLLQSTQDDIRDVLSLHLQQPFTTHLEVETYTWEVLPAEMQVPVADSIARELRFVTNLISQEKPTENA